MFTWGSTSVKWRRRKQDWAGEGAGCGVGSAEPQPVWQGALEQASPLIVSDWAEVGKVGAFIPSPPSVSRCRCPREGVTWQDGSLQLTQTPKLCLGSRSFERGSRGTHTTVCFPVRRGFKSWLLICTCCVRELGNCIFLGLTLPRACKWLRQPRVHRSLPLAYWWFCCPDPQYPTHAETPLVSCTYTVPVFSCVSCLLECAPVQTRLWDSVDYRTLYRC